MALGILLPSFRMVVSPVWLYPLTPMVVISPRTFPTLSCLSLERFNSSTLFLHHFAYQACMDDVVGPDPQRGLVAPHIPPHIHITSCDASNLLSPYPSHLSHTSQYACSQKAHRRRVPHPHIFPPILVQHARSLKAHCHCGRRDRTSAQGVGGQADHPCPAPPQRAAKC